MKKALTNYAFIDSQNLYRGMTRLGWKLDYRRFRIYLREKYAVETAYIFIGYMNEHQALYQSLQKAGFVLIFKTVMRLPNGRTKGNVDAELVLQAMIDFDSYEKAVIVSSDGDFACLVRHLKKNDKLKVVLSSKRSECSALLKNAAAERVRFLESLRAKLEYRPQK